MTIANINTLINFLCSTDDTQFTAANKLIILNSAFERLVGLIINADGTWQFDDTNYTDRPRGTIDLTDGQSAYTFSDEFLDVEWIKIKDINENWLKLTPIDQSNNDFVLENYLETDGVPLYYDKNGDTIDLYPAPSATEVTLTAGLKIQFKRTASIFTSAEWTTGNKVPGIASPYHEILAYMTAITYCMTLKKDRVGLYEKRVDEGIKDMLKYYSRREKDTKKVMTTKGILFR
jgi:hypothetical protein